MQLIFITELNAMTREEIMLKNKYLSDKITTYLLVGYRFIDLSKYTKMAAISS